MTNAVDRYGAPVASAYVPRTGDSAAEKMAASSNAFFGKDGPSFDDVLDAINPLNQLPFVGSAVNDSMDHKASTGAKLIGSALFGGPLGLVAGLINAVFEEATGKGVGESVVAALTGDETTAPDIQVASADGQGDVEVAAMEVPLTGGADDEGHDIQLIGENGSSGVHVIGATQAAAIAPAARPIQVADISSLHGRMVDSQDQAARDQAILSLYGSSPSSAHGSYKKAQMLPYLQDVTVSKVL